MTTLHVYATTEAFIPKSWEEVAGFTTARLVVTAYRKAAVAPLLEDRGFTGRSAEFAARSMRTRTPVALRMLNQADPQLFPLPVKDVAAYFWAGTGDMNVIYRVDATGANSPKITPIARFRRYNDGAVQVEPLNPDSGACPQCGSAEVFTFDPTSRDKGPALPGPCHIR